MKKSKIIEYIFLIILFCILFFNLFVLNIFENKYVFSIFLLIYFILCKTYLKSYKDENKNRKNVIFLMVSLAIVYVLILYIIGIFVGFYKNPIIFNFKTLYVRILPITGIIIFSELIRSIFISRKDKKSLIGITICLILIDILININLYSRFQLESVLTLIGYIGLSSVSINLLGTYTTKRYGSMPIILYKIITTLYIYIFSILPDIYLFFQSVFRIIYPCIIYVIIDFGYPIDNFKTAIKKRKINIAGLIATTVISIAIVLLVSCEFKYGILAVGSSSMTGSINKGDAVFFEKYTKQKLKNGQVIVFNKDNIVTIHRITDIQILNDTTIYFTKGDFNQQQDSGYITDSQIIGIVDFKIIGIGWPTIWIHEMFKN